MRRKDNESSWQLDDSLDELALLASTAGAQVVGRLTQKVDRLGSHYIGKGKLGELFQAIVKIGANLVVFDDELSPVQLRNLEETLRTKVIDRTALILDVFGRQARTREGSLQVELAQNEYLLPRLRGHWSHLERLGGGIGTRGPGETQLETDRRLVRRRIQKLRRDLEVVRRHRALYRRNRRRHGIPVVSLVGYTNAGKSTLFNSLSDAVVTAENRLFSTLDPVTRRVFLPNGGSVLITDTVGFIQKLPPRLIAAFRATLEELQDCDLLLHVVDITHTNAVEQVEVVDRFLEDLHLGDRPQLLVLNKADLLVSRDSHSAEFNFLMPERGQAGVVVSAAHRWGLGKLLGDIEARLTQGFEKRGARDITPTNATGSQPMRD